MNAEKKVSIPTIYNSFSTAENNKYQQADGIYSVDRFHKKPLKPQWFQGFQAKFHYCFPLRFPLSEVQHIFDKGIHPGGTGLLHLVGDVAQVALDGLDVVAAPDGGDSVGMPQIIETCVRVSNGGYDFLEIFVDSLCCQVAAYIIREYETVVLPKQPC